MLLIRVMAIASGGESEVRTLELTDDELAALRASNDGPEWERVKAWLATVGVETVEQAIK